MGRACQRGRQWDAAAARQFLVDERQHPRETARVSALSRSRGHRRLSQAMCGDRGEGLRGLHPRLAASHQGRRCLVPPTVKQRAGVPRASRWGGDRPDPAIQPAWRSPWSVASYTSGAPVRTIDEHPLWTDGLMRPHQDPVWGGHENQFPQPRLCGWYWRGTATFLGTRVSGQDAPEAVTR